jgi:hypothetical protein
MDEFEDKGFDHTWASLFHWVHPTARAPVIFSMVKLDQGGGRAAAPLEDVGLLRKSSIRLP